MPKGERFYQRFGKRRIARFPYFSLRFRCKECSRAFTSSFFELSYRDRLRDSYEEIFDLHLNGFSLRAIARFLKCDEHTVRQRKAKLARWTLLKQAIDTSSYSIQEPIAYDGLENFAYSQFDPNNLNHAIGKESYFLYDFNIAPMNRKGRMSPRQKKRKQELEEEHGRYPGNSIEKTSKRLFERLLEKIEGELHLHSDNHYAYRRALRKIRERDRIAHCITPSKLARNYRNRLFPINHSDMLSRHHLASFRRETIAFSKHTIAMLESFVLFMAHKNYMRPRFWKPHKQDETAHITSPAMKIGLEKKILRFREFFRVRPTLAQAPLNEDWLHLFQRKDPFSRRPIHAYNGI